MGAVSWPAAARARPRRKWAPPQGAPRSWHIALRAPDSQLTHKIGTHPPTRTPGHAAGRWEQLVDPWSRPTPTLGGCKTEKHDCRPQRASTPQLTAQRPSIASVGWGHPGVARAAVSFAFSPRRAPQKPKVATPAERVPGPSGRMRSARTRRLPELPIHTPGAQEGLPLLGGSVARRSEQPLSSQEL